MNVNPRNVKVSGLPCPRRFRLTAAKRPNSIRRVFTPMQFEPELLKPRSHRVPKASGIRLQLKTRHDVVGIPHDDHVALGFSLSPLLDPQVKDIVQINVGQQGRYDCALRGSHVTTLPLPFFQNARLEPLVHLADDAIVTDSVLQKTYQPLLIDRIEEAFDVGIE